MQNINDEEEQLPKKYKTTKRKPAKANTMKHNQTEFLTNSTEEFDLKEIQKNKKLMVQTMAEINV